MASMYRKPQSAGIGGINTKNQAARRLAAAGKRGDNAVGHLQTGEMVVPKSMQTPGLMAEFMRTARHQKRDPMKFVVGSSTNQVNPMTKMPMFADDFANSFSTKIPIDVYLGIEQLYFPKKSKQEESPLETASQNIAPVDSSMLGLAPNNSGIFGGEGFAGNLGMGDGSRSLMDNLRGLWDNLGTKDAAKAGLLAGLIPGPAGLILGGLVGAGNFAKGLSNAAEGMRGSGIGQWFKDMWDYDADTANALGRNRDDGITNWDRANAQDQAEEAQARADQAWAEAQNIGGLGEGGNSTSDNDFSGEGWF